MFNKLFGRKSEEKAGQDQKEPNMGGDRFADMEQELQETNPERTREAAGRYTASPVAEEQRNMREPRTPVYPTGNKPSVFSSGRNFTKQLGEHHAKTHENDEQQRVQGMPVVPKSQNSEYTREVVRDDDVKQAVNLLEQESSTMRNQTIRVRNIPEPQIPDNATRTANGYLVSAVMNEQQFAEFLKGNKNVLKLFPVLAEDPEKAAKLIESKKMIPVEVFDYNFFKQQVERVEQLAAENNIMLLRS